MTPRQILLILAINHSVIHIITQCDAGCACLCPTQNSMIHEKTVYLNDVPQVQTAILHAIGQKPTSEALCYMHL